MRCKMGGKSSEGGGEDGRCVLGDKCKLRRPRASRDLPVSGESSHSEGDEKESSKPKKRTKGALPPFFLPSVESLMPEAMPQRLSICPQLDSPVLDMSSRRHSSYGGAHFS